MTDDATTPPAGGAEARDQAIAAREAAIEHHHKRARINGWISAIGLGFYGLASGACIVAAFAVGQPWLGAVLALATIARALSDWANIHAREHRSAGFALTIPRPPPEPPS